MNDPLFAAARSVAQRLREAGHEAYFAGGCVRDRLLGRSPKDVDIATSARPEEVRALFRRTIAVGAHFGVIIVLVGDLQFDVATFRSDGAYGDGRRPDEVRFTTAAEDVARRDFTINGLLMDPESGAVIDHVGGQADLQAGLIRTIGRAEERFAEDHLRILRALRFACALDFEIEETTAAAIRRLAERAGSPSAERIFAELDRMFRERSPARALQLLDRLGLLPALLPELEAQRGRSVEPRLRASSNESFDGLERRRELAKRLLPPIDPALSWSIVLGDLDGGGPLRNARAATAVLDRLRATNELKKRVALLITCRDRLLFATRVSRCRLRLLAAHPDLDSFRLLHRVESTLADRGSLAPRPRRVEAVPLPEPLLRGDELVALGLPRGPALGRAMRRLRQRQLEGQILDPEEARDWVRTRYLDGA